MEQTLLDRVDYSLRPLGPMLGAEILGLDLTRPVSAATFKRIMADFETYHVLVFRDENLSKDDLIAFTALWGSVGKHVQRAGEVHTITNADERGQPKGSLPETSALIFHTDKSYMRIPALATFLYGAEVPPEGGDTLFSNMFTAYEALPADVKRKIEGLVALHSLEFSNQTSNNKLTRAEFDRAPPIGHPLVRRHPQTGRKSLYCGLNAWRIEGWSDEDSRELLDYLNDFATQPQFVYAHKWRKNDLVVWDNRCTLHAATPFDAGKYLRIMHRTVVEVAPSQW